MMMLFINIKVFQILQNKIILHKMYFLSVQLIQFIFQLYIIILSSQLLPKNLEFKIMVKFFYLAALYNKISYNVNGLIKKSTIQQRILVDNGLYNQDPQINKKGGNLYGYF